MQYHYVITVMSPTGLVGTYSGTWVIAQGHTRTDVYNEILAQVRELVNQKLNVMFFSLEPNELPVA